MDERDAQARLHDEENRNEFAIEREERRIARGEREMEREMKEFEEAEERAEREIEQEWRRERWGHEPERPPKWEQREK